MKKSFSFLEMILVIILISIALSISIPKNQKRSNLEMAAKKLIFYLNYTRYIAFLDDKEDIDDDKFLRKLWTLKFQKCSQDIGGLYFVVYSDHDTKTTHFKKSDCLKDPLSNKYLYSNYDCVANNNESKYILLTKQYGITDINVSCNTTSTLGQISFANDGEIYSDLSHLTKISNPCTITLYDKNNHHISIIVEPHTGFSYIHNL